MLAHRPAKIHNGHDRNSRPPRFCMWRMTGVWGRVARKSADGELWDEHRREYYGAPWTTNLNYCRVGEVFWERGMIFAWESDNGRLLG